MPPADPLVAPVQGNSRHSWQVLGMDCPSCARKIETAVSRVSGVQQARVLFATEKLVVDLAPGLSPIPSPPPCWPPVSSSRGKVLTSRQLAVSKRHNSPCKAIYSVTFWANIGSPCHWPA